jgi:16S rRNA (guanine966-N2)-methyltransferase
MRRGPRIVGGTLKGFRLRTAGAERVRPASSRARQMLFDLVGPEVEDASALDLFAGLGTVGLEALSRGAERVVFVEREAGLCRLLRANLQGAGCAERGEVICLEAVGAIQLLRARAEAFTLVFVDPPYGFEIAEATLHSLLESGILAVDAVVAIEHGRREALHAGGPLSLLWSRRMGYTVLSGYRYEPTKPCQSDAGTITPVPHCSNTPGGGGVGVGKEAVNDQGRLPRDV